MNLRHNLILCVLCLTVGTCTSNRNGICNDLTADIMFVLDATTNSFFYEMNRFLEYFTYDASGNILQNKTRFAAISFSTDSETCFNFSKPYSNDTGPRSRRDYTLASCMGIFPNATKANTEIQRNTAKAIKLARNQIQSSGRPGVKKIVILATDGLPQTYDQTLNEVRLLHLMDGVVMIVITTKQLSSAKVLISLTSSPLHFIYIDETDFTFDLDHQLLDLLCSRVIGKVKRAVHNHFTSCPSNQRLEAPRGKLCAVATWVPPVEDIDSHSGGEPGDCFLAGDHEIVYRYEGLFTWNWVSGDTCQFTIHVTVHYCPPLPGSDPNGRRSCTGEADDVYGSTCSHYCNSGYSLNGASAVTCNLRSGSAEWSSNFPSCQVQHCDVLPSFLNGNRQCTSTDATVFQSVCTHTCNTGFTLEGSSRIQCVAQSTSVQWSSTIPVCIATAKLCPPLPTFLNGIRDCQGGDYEAAYGSNCNFVCNKGYRLTGTSSVHCTMGPASAAWSSSFPFCEKEEMAEGDNQTGTIIGAVFGTLFGITGIILIIILIWIFYQKKSKHPANDNP